MFSIKSLRWKSERGWTGQKRSTPADPTLYTTVLISTYDFLLILHRTALKSVVQIGHRYEFLKLTSRALRPVQTVMMFDDSRWSFQLSFAIMTILFGFKRFMIADEIAYCKQIWRAPKSAISVTFEISVRKLRFEDIEAYQERMRVNQQGILQNFDAHFLSLYHLTIIRSFKRQKLTSIIISNLNMSYKNARHG